MKLLSKLVMILAAAGSIQMGSILAGAAPSNKELKIGIAQEFENLNPIIMSMSATTYLYYLGNRTLVTIDPNGKLVPKVAVDIPTLENKKAKFSTDKKSIIARWEIQPKATWSDGTPVTCNDLVLAHEIGSSANVATGEKEIWTNITRIEVDPKNPKKCTMTHTPAKWDFYRMNQFYFVPAHIEGPIWKQYKDVSGGYEKNSMYVKNPTMKGLYMGPYQLTEVRLGSHVIFEPNPHFYGNKPKIQKIIVKVIPNTGTLEANLRSETIDKVAYLGFSFDQAATFEKKIAAEKLPFEVVYKQSNVYEHIDLNLENPILNDIRVRKALKFAINREEMVKALFEGKQKVAIHNTAPMDPWFTADPKVVTLYPYNRRKAAQLLEEAGWVMNKSDGFRYKDGKKLTLQFMTTAGNKTRETVQTFLQSQWKSAGVEVVIKNEPARVFFGETTKKRKFEAMAMYAWVSSPENNPKSTYHSKNIPTEANGWSGQNTVAWKNAKADAAMDAIDLEFNSKKRVELMHEFLRHFTADVPVISLFYRSDVAVIPKNMKNFRLAGHQFAETNEAENWTLE